VHESSGYRLAEPRKCKIAYDWRKNCGVFVRKGSGERFSRVVKPRGTMRDEGQDGSAAMLTERSSVSTASGQSCRA
jgi:hypothetical protein